MKSEKAKTRVGHSGQGCAIVEPFWVTRSKQFRDFDELKCNEAIAQKCHSAESQNCNRVGKKRIS